MVVDVVGRSSVVYVWGIVLTLGGLGGHIASWHLAASWGELRDASLPGSVHIRGTQGRNPVTACT